MGRMDKEKRDQKRDTGELTEAEREALSRLPRERIPPGRLETRTVRALRAEGLLRESRSWATSQWTWIVGASAAAGLALFLGGVALGQSLGARQTAEALAAVYPDRTERAAAWAQSTGTAHAQALDALVHAVANAAEPDPEQAREVARATLWAAAAEVVRLAPDDPLAVRILQEFERARSAGAAPEDAARTVIWF